MQVVIDIPDEDVPNKQDIMDITLHFIDGEVCECTYPYIVLPKGHGRMIDADNIIPLALKKKTLVLEDTDLIDIRSREFVIDYLFKDIKDYINNMPTIIEADKAGK